MVGWVFFGAAILVAARAARPKSSAWTQDMRLFALIESDVRAKARWCYQGESAGTLVKTLFTDGTAAMVLYRLMQWSRAHRLWPLEMLCNRANSVFCNCIIGRGAEFGPRFVLIHATGVVINGGVRGGSDVRLEHQVTIGAERRRAPALGDDVFVGAGAKVLGDITVGSRVRVGANAVVIADVPADSTVVGVPARVVRVRAAPESPAETSALPREDRLATGGDGG